MQNKNNTNKAKNGEFVFSDDEDQDNTLQRTNKKQDEKNINLMDTQKQIIREII